MTKRYIICYNYSRNDSGWGCGYVQIAREVKIKNIDNLEKVIKIIAKNNKVSESDVVITNIIRLPI